MRLVRASWLTALVVIIVAVAVPALRHQFRLSVPGLLPGQQTVGGSCSTTTAALKPYQERAAAFVEGQYPNDPEMLMAAGVLAEDIDLLKRAAEAGNTPVTWAAYVEFPMKDDPAFERVGSSGVNPADAEAVAQEEKRIAESGLPDRLTPEQARPILSALRSWQRPTPRTPCRLRSKQAISTASTKMRTPSSPGFRPAECRSSPPTASIAPKPSSAFSWQWACPDQRLSSTRADPWYFRATIVFGTTPALPSTKAASPPCGAILSPPSPGGRASPTSGPPHAGLDRLHDRLPRGRCHRGHRG